MNKELQDLAWAYLPKEVREEMKGDYSQEVEDDTDKGYNLALRAFFGHHNLTSDTEPEELLMVERKKVQDAYKAITSDMRRAVLEELFGDKSQPDKEESVQVEPKFKKDEVVRSKSTNKVLKIYSNCAEIEKSSCLCVDEDGLVMSFPINDLEPYTEPETKDNMEGKKQFDLYVKGNIISNGKLSLDGESGYVGSVPEVEVDLSHGLIVEGDMTVDGLYIYGMKVACSGSLYAR